MSQHQFLPNTYAILRDSMAQVLEKQKKRDERRTKRQEKSRQHSWGYNKRTGMGPECQKCFYDPGSVGGLDSVCKARKKPKRKKSPPLSALKMRLWEEERHIVYAESPGVCMTCGEISDPMACHIVKSNDGAITRFFLPNIYRGCAKCNKAEKHRPARWRQKFEERFGKDFVDALYLMSEEDNRKPINEKFQLKKYWVIEQTERFKKLRGPLAS